MTPIRRLADSLLAAPRLAAAIAAAAICAIAAPIGAPIGASSIGAAGAQPAAAQAPGGKDATPAAATRAPVLVELFTSEGCSSCPPADDMLAWLVDEQPVPGVEVVALGFHVDYWDQLGWRDRFSSRTYTARQDAYSRSMRSDRIYTPQMVVDGTHEFIGNDPDLARRFIQEAASAVKLPIAIEVRPNPADPARVPLTIEVRPPADAALKGDVMVAVTEDGLVSEVQRGENAKKRLSHVAVVRSIDKVGRIVPGEPFTTTRTVSVNKKWRREGVKLVVLVQQARTGRVIGVATGRL